MNLHLVFCFWKVFDDDYYQYMILVWLLLLAIVHACPKNCLACNTLACIACAPGTKLTIDGNCTDSQLVPNCAVYLSSTSCSQCQPTYALDQSWRCQKDYSGCINKDLFTGECSQCMFGKELWKGMCMGVLNCQEYSSGQCVKCNANFSLKGTVCVWAGAGCLKIHQSTGSCLQCAPAYDLVGYQCISKSQLVPNCYLYQPPQCLICKTGYHLNNVTQCVLPPNSLCSQYDLIGKCIRCNNTRLRLVNGTCVDPFCERGSLGDCKECAKGFQVSKQTNLCELADANCKNISVEGSECLECMEGYFITSKRGCSVLPPNCVAADILRLTCITCRSGFVLQGTNCVQLASIPNCLLMAPSRLTCQVCQTQFYLSEGRCKRVSSLCNGYDPSMGTCLACKVGYINYGGQCMDPNCANQVGDTCQRCRDNFAVQPNGLCYFFDPNCQSATIRNCLRCKPGYYLDGQFCVKLPYNCLSVDQKGQCQQCAPQFAIAGNICVFLITGCSSYQINNSNQSQCTACQVGFNLVNATCQIMAESDPNCISVKDGVCILCSNRFYFEGKKCVPVNPTCKSYSMKTGQCTACYPGYMLHNGGCPPAPPKDPNCKITTIDGCTECYPSFFVSNGSCSPINTLCRTSNSTNGQCLSCFTGYMLSKGLCLAAYADPFCAVYDQNGVCLNCSGKYYMMKGVCTRVSPLCRTYNPNTGSCLTCYPGYYLAGGACWAGNDPNVDPNCNLRSLTGACLQCVASYYLADNGYCKAANPLCRTFNISNGNCLTCYSGYVIKDNTCALASSGSTDPNCLKFLPSGLCQQCYASFYVSGGVCREVNTLCRTANYSDGSCLSCYPGYSLSQGNCLIPMSFNQQATDPYCVTFQNGACALCRNGYYVQNGVCGLVDPQCRDFDYKASKCLQCYQGYTLTQWGCSIEAQAVIPYCQLLNQDQTCSACMMGYYRASAKSCMPVSILCFTYDENTGACTSCRGGYFLQGGSCIYPSMGADPHCINYDASAYCNKCKPGYYLLNYICTRVDPNCQKFDQASNTCLQCGNGLQPQGTSCIS